jgi:hypothetical protein
MQARFAVCCVRYRALHSVKTGPGPFPADRVIWFAELNPLLNAFTDVTDPAFC